MEHLKRRSTDLLKNHPKVLACIGLVILVAAVIFGGWYYENHRPYTQAEILSIIRKDILPSVVQIGCAETDGGPIEQFGSGLYVKDTDGSPWVVTSAHVILGTDGAYHGCDVYFPHPADGTLYDSVYKTGEPTLYNNVISDVNGQEEDGLDFAQLPLVGAETDATGVQYPFPPLQPNVMSLYNAGRLCAAIPSLSIGDPLYLIGYPLVGGDSETLTQGVISGFSGDEDQYGWHEWIKVSAEANPGSSGGVAIGAKDGCIYGYTTSVAAGDGSSIAYILNSGFKQSFTDGMTGEYTYEPPSADATNTASYLNATYDFPGFAIQYPGSWSVATTAPDMTNNGAFSVQFTSPSQGALDDFQEYMTVSVMPHSSSADLASLISDIKQSVVASDSSTTLSKYLVLQGVKTYQSINEDATENFFPVPVYDYRIAFLYQGTLYELESASEEGLDADAFMALFAHMGDSIKFK